MNELTHIHVNGKTDKPLFFDETVCVCVQMAVN